jgi:hypothetical protein
VYLIQMYVLNLSVTCERFVFFSSPVTDFRYK